LGTVAVTIGSLVAAILLAPPASASPTIGLAWLLFLGSSVHVAATGWLYTVPEVRAHVLEHRARYVWVPAGLVVGGAAVAAIVPPRLFVWVLLPYSAWQFFHFQKQNVGMASLAASSHRLTSLRKPERSAILAAGWAGIAGVMSHPGLLRLSANPGLGRLFPVAGLAFAMAVTFGVWAILRRPSTERPAGFSAVYISSLLFSVPIFLFTSPYAAVGGMILAHGLQYLVLVGLVAAGVPTRRTRLLQCTTLVNIALIGGLVLAATSHLHGSGPAGRLLYGAYLGVAMSHFVVDAGIWRLRDTFPRQFLSSRVPYLVPARSRRSPA
jgi:hypothetical protein